MMFFSASSEIYLAIMIGLYAVASLNWVIYFLYVWQLKEYRWDRFWEMLSTRSGLSRIINWNSLTKWALGLSLLINLLIIRNEFWLTLSALAIFLVDWLDLLFRITKRKLFRPIWTLKAKLLLVLNLFLVTLPLVIFPFFSNNWQMLTVILAILSLMGLPIVACSVLFFAPLSIFLKNRTIRQAAAKLKKFPQLKVIGITGSYGKSSTKEFLYQILSKRYAVLKTPKNINVDIGVAQVILQDLKPEHQIFICEMGAYKIGEIKKIGDLVRPQIGIITAVKDSHLALFGSLENIKRAKAELIESLPKNGCGIFNFDNETAKLMAHEAKFAKVVGFSTDHKEKDQLVKIKAENIIVTPEAIDLEINSHHVRLKMFGKQNIPNVLGAVCAALELGMTLEEICAELPNLKAPDKVMQLQKINQQLYIIDDSYNANPDGVIAALNYLNCFQDYRKIVVFPGMIELGEKSASEHWRVGKKIGEVADFALLTSLDFAEELEKGLAKTRLKDFQFIEGNQQQIWQILQQQTKGQPSVVLFESRGAEIALQKFLQLKQND